MISIMDVSWHVNAPVVVAEPTVGAIYELASAHGSNLFLIHDVSREWSTVVIPDLVLQFVDDAETPFADPVSATPLSEELSRGQMEVDANEPAIEVAEMCQEHGAWAVIVKSEGRPVGLFIPSVVAQRLLDTTMIATGPSDLRETVAANEFDITSSIRAIDAALTGFHSENLNYRAPDPYICEGGGQPHHAWMCPHSPHPAGPCGRRQVIG